MTGNYIGNNPNSLDVVLSDSYETNKSQLIASTKCVNNVYNNLKELIDSKGGGLPLGHIYLWPFSTPPDGSIQLNGSEYNRELYSDLWTLIQTKGWYKPESEWQQIASANGGYCPWYSNGDGSTTFRTPKFAPYQKLSFVSGDAGKYYEAGLPTLDNISFTTEYILSHDESRILSSQNNRSFNSNSISDLGSNVITFTRPSSSYSKIKIKRDTYSEIYGSSDTVTPESNDWIVCVVAFGSATNVGEVDVANVMTAVGQVQSNPNLQGTAHIVETWKSDDGTSWYRKWSDGWIEQGVKNLNARNGNDQTETLLVPFSTNTYTLVISAMANISENYDVRIKSTSTTSFIYGLGGSATGMYYVACGY